ncbi:MAG: tripartite tricarboxylate transporter substrate binding protein [Betaproteobacteria bacterium]|nr:MAG: tripartite tricarboxylate transporter substrate binding protein [Betaproteobacteria bacterium]
MRKSRPRFRRRGQMVRRWILVLATAAAAGAGAQDFPSRPVRIVVPWPPSGNVDITARTVAPAFSEALGQQVIVENLSGAGGRIGTAAVAKASADGYTLLLGSIVAIGPIQSVPIVLTAAPKTPVSSYKEFVALANAKPGQVSIASAGSGSSNHLAIELLMRQANLKLLHIPYKGSGPAIIDLLGSQVESMMDQLTASLEHIRSGRLKALAVSSKTRSALLPNVPTLDELGVKGYEASTFTGLFAPSGVTGTAADKLYAALRRALSSETVRERYRSMGVDILDMSRAEFTAYVRADFEKWRAIARAPFPSLVCIGRAGRVCGRGLRGAGHGSRQQLPQRQGAPPARRR